MLEREQPDLIVCTHFLPAEIISWMKAKRRLACPQAIVVTDFDVHAMWLCHHYEHYFVALDETREHMIRLGIPADEGRRSTGIPIDPVFAEAKDKAAMRKKHGLAPGKTTILLSAGGFGVGPIEHIVTTLFGLAHPAQIVAICGRNAELKARMDGARGRPALHAAGCCIRSATRPRWTSTCRRPTCWSASPAVSRRPRRWPRASSSSS